MKFVSLPPVLHLHLKRFEYDPYRDAMVKVNDRLVCVICAHSFEEKLYILQV